MDLSSLPSVPHAPPILSSKIATPEHYSARFTNPGAPHYAVFSILG